MYSALRTNIYMSRYYGACLVTCRDTESDSLLMVTVCSCPLARLLALLLNTSASLPPSSLYLTSSASSHENTHQRTGGFISNLTTKGKLVRASERGLRLKHHYLKSFFFFFPGNGLVVSRNLH